jgi:hypothetical protein
METPATSGGSSQKTPSRIDASGLRPGKLVTEVLGATF